MVTIYHSGICNISLTIHYCLNFAIFYKNRKNFIITIIYLLYLSLTLLYFSVGAWGLTTLTYTCPVMWSPVHHPISPPYKLHCTRLMPAGSTCYATRCNICECTRSNKYGRNKVKDNSQSQLQQTGYLLEYCHSRKRIQKNVKHLFEIQ